ncbi:MAG: ABC transporter permease [Flavobacteriales bacterium]
MNRKIYTPSNNESLIKLFTGICRGLVDGHTLGLRLFRRDLKAGFEASILGYAWTILPPLASAALWVFLNNQRVIKVTDTGMSYSAFVLIGTTFWAVFSESVNKPIQRYKSAMAMMVKLNFPREALAIASVYDLLFSMTLKLLVLYILLFALGVSPSLSAVGLIPLLAGVVFIGISIGIFIAPFGILFNDISRALNMALPFLMYLSPVVYAVSSDSFLGRIQVFNPMASWIDHGRWLIGGLAHPVHSMLIVWTLLATLMLLLGLIMLRIALPIIVERSGS